MTGHLVRFSFLLIFCTQIFGQSYPVKEVDSLYRAGLFYIENAEYEKAETTFKLVKVKYPEVLIGQIYLAGLPVIKASDFKYRLDDEAVVGKLDSLAEIIEEKIEDEPANSWLYYKAGLVQNFSVYYHNLNQSSYSSLLAGLDAVSFFEECVRIDSSFSDAWIMIGCSKIYKSYFTRNLTWLPFLSDESEEGIQLINNYCDEQSLSYSYGTNTLAWQNIVDKKFSEAAERVLELNQKYPGNRVYKWTLATAYSAEQPIEAIKIFKEIEESYEASGAYTNYAKVELYHKIAQRYLDAGENGLALDYCNFILDFRLTDKEFDILGERLDRVTELKEDIKNIQE